MPACPDLGLTGALVAAVQGYMDLVIITAGPKGNMRAPCTFSLVAKDGVYLMQIPRPVDSLVLAAGNRRAFLLWLFCSATVLLHYGAAQGKSSWALMGREKGPYLL